jgi:hypothetical protein
MLEDESNKNIGQTASIYSSHGYSIAGKQYL